MVQYSITHPRRIPRLPHRFLQYCDAMEHGGTVLYGGTDSMYSCYWKERSLLNCRCRIRPRRNTEYVPSRPFAIFIQVSNRGRNGCNSFTVYKSWFCQYISIPMKYTVSGSILQYKVGPTLSFFKNPPIM